MPWKRPFTAAFSLASLLLFHREVQRGQGIASAALLFLATLARPEAFLVVAALAVLRGYWMRRLQLSLPFLAAWLGVLFVPACVFEALRFGYYGQLLPNTYFAKSQPLVVSFWHGAVYLMRATSPLTAIPAVLWRELRQVFPNRLLDFHSLAQKNLRADLFSFGMPLLFWALALAGLWRIKRRILGGLAVAGGHPRRSWLFVLRAGGDWMYGWRFMAPIRANLLAVSQCHAVRALRSVGLPGRNFQASPGANYAHRCPLRGSLVASCSGW